MVVKKKRIMSLQSRKNISEGHKGLKHSEETKSKISKGNKGIPKSDKQKKNHSKIMKQYWTTEEYRAKHQKSWSNTGCELEFKKILDDNNIEYVQQYFVKDIESAYPADFYLPDYNCIVEIDGQFWHHYPKGNQNDYNRTNQLKRSGYKVLRYWEMQFTEKEVLNDLKNLDKLKIYLSSGWFSDYQEKALSYIEKILFKRKDFIVYSPRKNLKLKGNEKQNFAQHAFDTNIKEILKSDIIVSSTVEKDTGTLFENGFAFGVKKPIIYTFFDERFSKAKFNMMLSQSGIASFTDKEQFEKFIALLSNENYLTITKEYEGEFE